MTVQPAQVARAERLWPGQPLTGDQARIGVAEHHRRSGDFDRADAIGRFMVFVHDPDTGVCLDIHVLVIRIRAAQGDVCRRLGQAISWPQRP